MRENKYYVMNKNIELFLAIVNYTRKEKKNPTIFLFKSLKKNYIIAIFE